MEKSRVKKIIEEIDGWLTDKEGELLYDLAKKCSNGVIVEIGSWKGKSTIWLGCGSKIGNKNKVYAIDPHTGSSEHQKKGSNVYTFDEFRRNISKAGLDNLIVPLVKTSEEASKEVYEPVGLIFIDGDHNYETVKKDFELWFPKLINGGIMAFHDSTGWMGVKKIVKGVVYFSQRFRNVGLIDSITYGEKVEQNSVMDRLKNIYVFIFKKLYETAKQIKKDFLKIFR